MIPEPATFNPGDGLMHVIDMLGMLDMQRSTRIAELEARLERAEEIERQAVLAATEAMNGHQTEQPA